MDSASAGSPRARIVIPVWGAKYVARLDQACLPALLAPGNLPYLASHFDCELVIVTQAAQFEQVRGLEGVRAAARWSRLRLVAMDDVLSHPSYYGYTITHALYRGFTDLGDDARNVWFLFLNADFILADGSYRALVERIQAGDRCILAPSYCTIEEDVRPLLEARLRQRSDGTLPIAPREMAGMILEHRHFTIRAKIVNWRMYRIDRVDQFYYVVDNDTMVGRQIPAAVVAFRPERVPQEPVAFWDYGIASEVCPSGPVGVIGDSDDFLMMELRGRATMSEQLQLGWMDKEAIARDLTLWTTKDQRASGEFTLVLHRADPPPTLQEGIDALEAYYRDVMRSVASQPRDHRNHYIWTSVVDLHREWLASRGAAGAPPQRGLAHRLVDALHPPSAGSGSPYARLFDVMRGGYRALFGSFPRVGAGHPYGADLGRAIARLDELGKQCTRALAGWSIPGAALAPHLSRWVAEVETARPAELLAHAPCSGAADGPSLDLCLLELSLEELLRFGELHRVLRKRMRRGGKILAFYRTRGEERVEPRNFRLIAAGLPASDLAEISFQGGVLPYYLQRVWETQVATLGSGVPALLRVAAWAAAMGPFSWWSNWRQRRRTPRALSRYCTSLLIEVTVL